MPGTHNPHTPQPTNTSFSLDLSFKKELYTLASWQGAPITLFAFGLFFHPCPSLLYTRSREKISPFLGSQKWVTNRDMSGDYTCTSFAFLFALIFSLEQQLKRENYTPAHQHHYTPFLGTPEMSDKLRYEWQIILRYYVLIIHELTLERPTTTTC